MIWNNMLMAASGKKPVEFVGSSSLYLASGGSMSVPKPSGVQAGDLLLAFFYNNSQTRTLATLSGWTQYATGDDSGAASLYFKIAGGSEPSTYDWGTWSGTGNSIGVMLVYRNATAINASSGMNMAADTSTSMTLTGFSATAAGALCAFWAWESSQGSISTPPAGMTQRSYNQNGTPGAAAYDLTPSPSGASGNKSLTRSGQAYMAGILLQIT